MDRIIEVKVGGNYISKDNKNAGVRGEANVAKLRITFDEGWNGYTKKVTFWDARGLNPVEITLLPTLAENETTYLVPIPAEPMEEAGMLTFVIEGTVDDKVQRSLSDTLEVKDAPIAPNAGQPVPPTEDKLTQLGGEIEKIKDDILEVKAAKEETKTYRNEAEEKAAEAKQSAIKAENAVGKTSYIGDNGNWFEYDSEAKGYVDTGVYATGPVGPEGKQGISVTHRWDGTVLTVSSASGTSSVDLKGQQGEPGTDGYSPVRGTDYWTEHDKEVIQSQIKLPILRGIYNPQAVSLSVDGAHAVSGYLDSAGNYGWSMAGSDSLGFFFPLEDNVESLLGKNIDYKLTINTVAEATTLLESAYIGIAFVKFEDTVDPNGVTSYSSISSNSIINTINGAHTYSSVLPETVPYGYGGCKLAIYALFNYSAYADGLVSVSNPSAIIDVENPDNWFVWNAAANRYVNSNVSAKGYIPQKGIDYWTASDIAEIKGYVDENMESAEKVGNKVTALTSTNTDTQYPTAKAVVDYVGKKIPLIVNIWEDEGGKVICGSENVYTDLKSAVDAHRPIIVYQWDSSAMNYFKQSYISVTISVYGGGSLSVYFSGTNNYGSRMLIFVGLDNSHYTFGINKYIYENTENKVATLSVDSTDDEYPTAKAVVDYVGNIETALERIIAEQNSIIAIQNTLIGGESA